MNLLPEEAEGVDVAVSLYDLRKRYGGDFVPQVQGAIADAPGLWIGYWGDEAKKHDIFDVLTASGFTRTGTLEYDHHGNAIFAYRYDRLSALNEALVTFEDSPTLARAVWPESVESRDDLNALLWWRADDIPARDYTVSVFLLDSSGMLRAQHDAYPANGAAPMTTWTPDVPVFDPHTLDLDHVPPGEYTLAVKLYVWPEGTILPAGEGNEYAVLGTVHVE